MQHLPPLLPGFFPAPAVFELVEQILNRPASAVGQNDAGRGQRQVGAQDQPLLAKEPSSRSI
jgi:hypothetical protein